MYGDIVRMKKAFADPIEFKFVEIGQKQEVMESLDRINVNDFAEIIFLCKYIGDYNITKYGNKLTFENKNKLLVMERIII